MPRFRNTIQKQRKDPHPPTVRKVPADSVPYGESISHNSTVWAAYDAAGTLIAVAATAGEVRRHYRLAQKAADDAHRKYRETQKAHTPSY